MVGENHTPAIGKIFFLPRNNLIDEFQEFIANLGHGCFNQGNQFFSSVLGRKQCHIPCDQTQLDGPIQNT